MGDFRLKNVPFDLKLDGDHELCELDWCKRLSDAGFNLAAAPLLGVLRNGSFEKRGKNWVDCLAYFLEKHCLSDSSKMVPIAGASIPLESPSLALQVLHRFYSASSE